MTDLYFKKLTSNKHLFFLAFPIFIELLLNLVVGYADQIMMSKYPNAVNGITNANVIINMIINVFSILSSAAIILISQYRGFLDKEKEEKVYGATFWFSLILSLLFSVIIVLTCRYYLKWIKTPSSSYNDAVIYSLICGGFIFLQTMSTTISSLLKANNLMKDSMFITIIVNLINVVGNYFLIIAFSYIDKPIIGVALSSTISRAIGLMLMLIVYYKKVKKSLSFKSFMKSKSMVKILLKIGGPSTGESLSYNSSQIVIQLAINAIVIAASNNVELGNIKTYASMFANVTYMFATALSQAMQVVIGELLGAHKIKAVDEKVKQTVLMSIIVSTIFSLTFYFFSDYLFAIFDVKDSELLKVAKHIMGLEIILELGRAFNIVYVRALQTSGDVMFPTVTAIISCWLIAVGGSFIFGLNNFLNMGIEGVWLAMGIDECLRAIIFIIRWKKGKWKKIDLSKMEV